MQTTTTYKTGPRAGQQIAADRRRAELERIANILAEREGRDAARTEHARCVEPCSGLQWHQATHDEWANREYDHVMSMTVEAARERLAASDRERAGSTARS